MRKRSYLALLLAVALVSAAVFLPGFLLDRQQRRLFQEIGTRQAADLQFGAEEESTLCQRIAAKLAGYYEMDFEVGAALYYDEAGLVRRFLEELGVLADADPVGQAFLTALEANVGTLEELNVEQAGDNLLLHYSATVDRTTGASYWMGRLTLRNFGSFHLEMDMTSGRIVSMEANLAEAAADLTGNPEAFSRFAEHYADYLGLELTVLGDLLPYWYEAQSASWSGDAYLQDQNQPEFNIRYHIYLAEDYFQWNPFLQQ